MLKYSSVNKLFVVCFIIFGLNLAYAQKKLDSNVETDSLYREDQFYVGPTYNLLGSKPSGIEQSGFSLGFHFGFIRDMPINKKRNIALGIGLGYSANSYNNNLFVERDNDSGYIYSILDESMVSFSKNKLTSHMIELPIEFRWRTSNSKDYNFWRIYAGVKLGYVIRNSTKFIGDSGNLKLINNSNFNDFQYGMNISFGYNTWNIYMYYGLNPIFKKDSKLNSASIDMNAIKIGLMFYIL